MRATNHLSSRIAWPAFATAASSPCGAFNAVTNDPESVAHFAKQNQYAISGTPEDYGRLLANETETWSKLIRALNIQFE